VCRLPPRAYSSYRKLPHCTPSDYFRYPQTLEDVVSIVKEAIARGTTVKGFGARHSQTDIICTEGIPVETFGLNWMRLNPDSTATFGSGVILYEATKFLRENGRALRTTPAFGNITIGGAVGTGAHGSTFKYNSSISSQVVRMTIVDGLGNVREISEEEDLYAFRIHLGLLGFIVDITLDTHPLYKVRAHNYEVSESVLSDGSINRWLEEVDQLALYWFPTTGRVVVANWTIVPVETPGEAWTNDHVPPSSVMYNLLTAPTADFIQGLTTSICSSMAAMGYSIMYIIEEYFIYALLRDTPYFVPIYTEDGETVKNPAVGYYDQMFAPTCRSESNYALHSLFSNNLQLQLLL
jgi:L-gulonolactone oxidase